MKILLRGGRSGINYSASVPGAPLSAKGTSAKVFRPRSGQLLEIVSGAWPISRIRSVVAFPLNNYGNLNAESGHSDFRVNCRLDPPPPPPSSPSSSSSSSSSSSFERK